MSDVQSYLLEVDRDRSEARKIAEQSARRLENKDLKLIDLITSLEEYINKKDDNALRAKSLAYLADVLSCVGPRALSGYERRLFCDFLLGRIENDVEGIGESARALMALEQRGKWDAGTAQKAINTLIDFANPLKQFTLQSERFAVIQLVDLLLAKYRTAIHELHENSEDFLTRLIMLFDGEKDPRNLMIVFSLLQVPMTEWDLRTNAQDLFDSVFNYFPITFKPPPDDPYGITAQDLKDRLRECISSTSDFAPYAFPALLDKLDSTSMNTKRDVLRTLQDCVVRYEAKTINLYSVTLWDALKFEILAVQEEDLAEEALKTLGLIAAKLSEAGEGPLNAYLRPVVKECNEHLEDAPTKQSQAAGRILHAVASGSPIAAEKLVKGIFPITLDLYRATQSLSKRRGLLEVVHQLLKAFVEIKASGDVVLIESLQSHSKDILDIFLQALAHSPKAEVSFRLVSLDGLVDLTRLNKVLSESELDRVVDSVTNVVIHEHISGHGDIRSEAISRLSEMAHAVPDVVRDRSIPAFMVELPDIPRDTAEYKLCLEAFAQLSTERQIFDTIVIRIKNKFNAARHQGAPKAYQQALLVALLYAFTYGSPVLEDGALRSSYFSQYAEPLLDQLPKDTEATWDSTELEIVGRICNFLLRQQSHHFQSTVYNKHMHWLSRSDDDTHHNQEIRRLAPFLLYYYAALRVEVVEPNDLLTLLRDSTQVIKVTPKFDTSISTLLRFTTLLVDKFAEAKSIERTLQELHLDLPQLLSGAVDTHSLGLAFAITKALLVQGKSSAHTKKNLEQLLAMLSTMSKPQARLFTTLLAPDDIVSKENHCIISGLYKQRTFAQLVPPLVAAIRSSDGSTKPNYLIALSGILRWLPYSIIESSLSTLVAPLLQALDLTDSSDQDVKLSALTIFESVLMHDPKLVADHVASFISRLLNATGEKENGHKVRASALQCLSLVPKQLQREKVIPYRRQVVKRLLGCLDDGRRNVRAEAVRCRTNWLGLEEADEDE